MSGPPAIADTVRPHAPVCSVPTAAFDTMVAERGRIAKIGGFPLDPTLGAASIRIAVCQLQGDS
jgi:hypothetical protein